MVELGSVNLALDQVPDDASGIVDQRGEVGV